MFTFMSHQLLCWFILHFTDKICKISNKDMLEISSIWTVWKKSIESLNISDNLKQYQESYVHAIKNKNCLNNSKSHSTIAGKSFFLSFSILATIDANNSLVLKLSYGKYQSKSHATYLFLLLLLLYVRYLQHVLTFSLSFHLLDMTISVQDRVWNIIYIIVAYSTLTTTYFDSFNFHMLMPNPYENGKKGNRSVGEKSS